MRTFLVRLPEPEIHHGLDGYDGLDGESIQGPRGPQGERGEPGPPGEGKPGPAGPPGKLIDSWRDDWKEGVSYEEGDVVYFNRSSYICTKAHVSNLETNYPKLENRYWNPLARGGASGTPGSKGVKGDTGETGASGRSYYVQDTEPAGAATGDLWVNTSVSPPRTYVKS